MFWCILILVDLPPGWILPQILPLVAGEVVDALVLALGELSILQLPLMDRL